MEMRKISDTDKGSRGPHITMTDRAAAALRLLYRDDHLAAVDKPPGLLVHRTRLAADEDDALLQRLRDTLGRRVYAVHRLDRPTSGVVVYGLTPEAARRLSLLFETRRMDKRYLAVVRGWLGTPQGPGGVIDYPLADAPDLPARPALTHYRSLARVELPHAVGRYPTSRYSLLELRPRTGRTHQIRRHLHHIFHPIVGDTTHGEGRHNRLFREHYACERLLLHARSLGFIHPFGGASLRVEAPPDAQWQALMARLGWPPLAQPDFRDEPLVGRQGDAD
jgi:tRNA pseudouridine65 synthase